MGYSYGFADNAVYGAEDMNKLTSRLVTGGIADPFVDDLPYNMTKVNDVVKLVYAAGVVPDSVNTCKVTKTGDGAVKILPGLAFFDDGSTIEVDADGVALTYQPGVKNYVYLKPDLQASNRNYPVCSAEAPGTGCVLLAEISADGELTDKRTYAKGKVPGYASNANMTMVIDQTFTLEKQTDDYTYDRSTSFEVDLGTNNYSYVTVMSYAAADRLAVGLYDIATGTYWSASGNDVSTKYIDVKIFFSSSSWVHLTFSKTGNILTGLFDGYTSSSGGISVRPLIIIS